MVAIIKNNFRLQGAKEFIKNFATSVTDKNYYLFVGKPLPWKAPENQTDSVTITSSNADLYPPLPDDTLNSDRRIWDEMLGLKRIRQGDVTLVIPRSDWKTRTIYSIFDDGDANLHRHPTLQDVERARATTPASEISDPNLGFRKAGNFYALNSLNELFVCLWNNNGGVSTVEPMRAGNPLNLAHSPTDNYVWKYITSITSGDAVKFLTDAWIPIKTLGENEDNGTGQIQVQNAAKKGQVLGVVVTNVASPAQFPNVYTGTVTISTASNKQATINTSPSEISNAYAGYHLHIINPSTNVRHIFNISSYTYNDITQENGLSISETFVGLVAGQSYACNILPKLDVYSNGSTKPILVPVVDSASKQLVSVNVLDSGENATFVSADVVRPAVGTTQALPSVRVLLASLAGLGKDPEKDLGAFFVMVSAQIKYDEGTDQEDENAQPHLADFPVKNDYRQIGILQNARVNDGTTNPILCTSQTLRATKRIKVEFVAANTLGITGDPGFKSDEEIEIKNSSGEVLGKIKAIDFKFFDRTSEVSAYTGEITFVQTPDTRYTNVELDQEVSGTVSNARAIIRDISNEELKKFSGDILYIENRRPVLRSVDQIEDIKTIIEF